MGNIFNIVIRVFPFIVLVFYEIISFYVIYRNNDFYQSNIISRSNLVVSSFYDKIDSYKSYLDLYTQNQRLANENSQLRNELIRAQVTSVKMKDDSIAGQSIASIQENLPGYSIINAKVISNSIANIRNFIIVNKGANQGVTKDMGVISDQGPVGIVIEVSANYACVMSLINKDAIFSARVKSTEHVGQLRWSGYDPRMAILDEIPKHIQLKRGDEIVTSGYSSYFPENIKIGRVLKQKDDASNFANIQVQLYNDFSNLSYVYLIANSKKEEIKQIETSIKELQRTNKNDHEE